MKTQMEKEWTSYYLSYDQLKDWLKSMEATRLAVPDEGIGSSLSTPIPTTMEGMQLDNISSQEDFFTLLDREMKKIELFTKERVQEYRATLAVIESQVDGLRSKYPDRDAFMQDPGILTFRQQVQSCGDSFLRLEKYVNLNFMGFVKILKKHDKHLPNPCRAFYTARLHEQSWVRGDYSDVMVTMSRIYSKLRKDRVVAETDDAKQNFVRSTRKYWVHTEDISAVKYSVLQHLPVFLQSGMSGESDAQLTTSIYVDNFAMELYKGRLDKSPGAIALRFRWYGTKPVETVFVERKTHREQWMGDMSVKERFTVKEPQVMDLLRGTFNINEEVERLRSKNKKEQDIEEYEELATEIAQAIQSKQLFPTMRTQYMRTAFQIPFDATVRISLDTNLTMINERIPETLNRERWYRDPSKMSIPPNDVTRFPHAVLEVKLQLEDESQTPAWVEELINSGKLLEVHKFSKFLHGCAVLLPEDVPAMPYWIDDVTLADSIIKSGSGHIISGADKRQGNPLLPHDAQGNAKAKLQAIGQGTYVPSAQSVISSTHTTANSNTQCSTGSQSPNADTNFPLPQSNQSYSNVSGNGIALLSAAAGNRTNFSAYNNANPIHSYNTSLSARASTSGAPRMKKSPNSSPVEDRYYRMGSDEMEAGRSHTNPRLCDCWGNCCGESGGGMDDNNSKRTYLCSWADAAVINRVTTQKVEPKTFFANERTFISWLNMAVFMSSMSIAVMAFASNSAASLSFPFLLMPLSLIFIAYALNTFLVRGRKIASRDAERWDDPYGPPFLASLLGLVLFAIFVVKVVQLVVK